MKEVEIFTAGSCPGDPGRGGFGSILVFKNDCVELSGGFRHTTNNRMEMMACIVGLEALDQEYIVTVYCESKFLVDSATLGWATTWRRNNWKQSSGSRAANVDLWERLLSLIPKHYVHFILLKSHSGHPDNERSHQLATSAANGSMLQEDPGYTARDVKL